MTENGGSRRKRALSVAGAAVGLFGLSLLGGYIGAGLRPAAGEGQVRLPRIIHLAPQKAGPLSDADLVEAACPAVVSLAAGGSESAKSPGFLVSRQGAILAASDAIAGDTAIVEMSDGRRLPAKRVADDPLAGIALFKIDANAPAVLDPASADYPRVGARGLALSVPGGRGCALAPLTVASDFVTDGGSPAAYLQPTPAPPAEMAGAPVIASDGQLLGVVMSRPAGSQILPAAVLAPIVAGLLRGEQSGADRLGMEIGEVTPALADRLGFARQRGAMVTLIAPDSPAGKAGLQAGDVILSVDDAPVSSASEAGRALAETGARNLLVLRAGQELKIALPAAKNGGDR